MKIVVTGGAGFIGSNFIFYMIHADPSCRIVCLDKLTYAGRLSTLAPVMDDPRFRFVRADICDADAVTELLRKEKPDAVVNFAAESHVDRSIEDPGVFLRTNILGVQTLMDACLRCDVSRYHQVSTDEVYGDLPLDRPELLFTEESPLRAGSPYAASKASADLLVMAYCRTYGLQATVSRCSNNYGPYQFPEMLIPLMIVKALHDQPMPVYGQGFNVRDWIHVQDHCRAIELILRSGQPGEVYNVGGRCERRNIDIVRRICSLLGKPDSSITYVADRKGHDLRYAIDSSKICNELGWKPEVGFNEGLEYTIEWYLNHRGWWEELI